MKFEPKEKRINDLIEAAQYEFLSKSYAEVTLESIAGRAGMPRSTAHYYYTTKDAILGAVGNRLYETVRAMMIFATEKADAMEALHKLLPAYLCYWAKHPRETELHLLAMSRIAGRRAAWPEMNAHVAAWIDWYEALLRKSVKQGTLRPHDTRSRATALFMAMEGALGYAAMTKIFKPKRTAARIEKALLEDVMVDAARWKRQRIKIV
jgi:AcrR family transcriptional regulator